MEQSPKFKLPAKPTAVRTERAIAYVLCRHRRDGWWTPEQVGRAWQTFLKVQCPKLQSEGGWSNLAAWLMLRFWNPDDPQNPSPGDALRRVYDYWPGVDPPPPEFWRYPDDPQRPA